MATTEKNLAKAIHHLDNKIEDLEKSDAVLNVYSAFCIIGLMVALYNFDINPKLGLSGSIPQNPFVAFFFLLFGILLLTCQILKMGIIGETTKKTNIKNALDGIFE